MKNIYILILTFRLNILAIITLIEWSSSAQSID